MKQVSPSTLLLESNHELNLSHTDIVSYEQRPLPVATNTKPNEVCATFRADDKWFYASVGNASLKPVDRLGEQIRVVNDRNGSFLLDVTPDKAGLIPESQLLRLTEIKSYLDNPPPLSIAIRKALTQSSTYIESANYSAAKGNDVDNLSFTATADGDFSPWWKVDLGQLTAIGEVDPCNRLRYEGRLRDIYFNIIDTDGTTVVYTSSLLNLCNSMGGGISNYRLGPNPLTLTLGNGVVGRFVRVRRVAEEGFASDTTGNKCILTLAEVRVFAAVPEPPACTIVGVSFAIGGLVLRLIRRSTNLSVGNDAKN